MTTDIDRATHFRLALKVMTDDEIQFFLNLAEWKSGADDDLMKELLLATQDRGITNFELPKEQ
jgi:hypothetical protein